ncbi:MAG: ABC transporter ATP-binding protein [Candidatus Dependentiae bacterium]|nr:ABC transporter ATP-binding protein [Candidatus Dependentiae bacterium]
MPSKCILAVNSLVKIFEPKGFFIREHPQGSFTAIDNISFTMQPGEIIGLLGTNGSGKSTIMQMLLGTVTPTSGTIEYFGKDFSSNRSEILQHIGFASSYIKLAPRLTIYENLDVFGRLYGLGHTERAHIIETFLKFFGLWDMRHKETATLSAGQTTRVMLAKAFFAKPKIVLLDEPTASLDPDIAYEMRQFVLQQQRDLGISILLASHNMDEVTELCNRVLVIKQGKLIANDTPALLASRIATSRVQLTIKEGLDRAVHYARHNALPHAVRNTTISIEINEQKVATLLTNLAHAKVAYAGVTIEKPTLQDYFLQIAEPSRTPSHKAGAAL